jgi:hypothetical protein
MLIDGDNDGLNEILIDGLVDIDGLTLTLGETEGLVDALGRSEERRVGKEC